MSLAVLCLYVYNISKRRNSCWEAAVEGNYEDKKGHGAAGQ